MAVNGRRGQSQICGDQDIGLRFEDSFGCWMQFINKRRLHELKSFIWCICTASEIERETSFFPISIHTMWIGKLSLWSLRSNPLPPHNPSQDQELVEWNQKVCVGLSHLYSFYPALDSRENPFIKLDSDLFSRFWLRLRLPSLCVHIPDQRVDSEGIFSEQWNQPLPIRNFLRELESLKIQCFLALNINFSFKVWVETIWSI